MAPLPFYKKRPLRLYVLGTSARSSQMGAKQFIPFLIYFGGEQDSACPTK